MKGFSQALTDAIFMMGGEYKYDIAEVENTINESSGGKFLWSVLFSAYGTFILAFIVLTIALSNMLIRLSVNIAQGGLRKAKFQRLNALANNLCCIGQLG